jgi:hypothetical protein
MIASEIKKKRAFVQLKNEPPIQICPTFEKFFPEFPNGKAGVNVRIAKAFYHEFDGVGNFLFASGVADDFFEPLGQFN